MIEQKTVLAFIPARGGSKGIKNKNLYPVGKKPLIAYTIEAARQSKYIDKILVSTDSPEIGDTARMYGADVPFLRPAQFAQDHSKSIDAVMHALGWLKERGIYYDIFVLLQPTQPLRITADIDQALERFIISKEKSLASVSKATDHPLLLRKIGNDGRLSKLLSENSTVRRQDMQQYYRVNGCIYINRTDEISVSTSFNDNEIPFIMPKTRSLDIDEKSDITLAEYYLERNVKED